MVRIWILSEGIFLEVWIMIMYGWSQHPCVRGPHSHLFRWGLCTSLFFLVIRWLILEEKRNCKDPRLPACIIIACGKVIQKIVENYFKKKVEISFKTVSSVQCGKYCVVFITSSVSGRQIQRQETKTSMPWCIFSFFKFRVHILSRTMSGVFC